MCSGTGEFWYGTVIKIGRQVIIILALCLLVHSISHSIWKSRTQNKVHVMLDACHHQQTGRQLDVIWLKDGRTSTGFFFFGWARDWWVFTQPTTLCHVLGYIDSFCPLWRKYLRVPPLSFVKGLFSWIVSLCFHSPMLGCIALSFSRSVVFLYLI